MMDRVLWWVIALVASLALAACGLVDDTPTYRYRLTVEVETPQGLRTGSSVIEVETYIPSGFFGPMETMRLSARGEAVAIDLPVGRTLFALLRSESNNNWASGVMSGVESRMTKNEPDSAQARFANLLALEGRIVLPRMSRARPERSTYPMLVTFGDLTDPASVERVDPDDLAASFGEGVRLKRITVQMTDDPVTTGIDTKLVWLEQVGRKHAWLKPSGSRYLDEAEPINLVSPGDFSTELWEAE